MQCGTSQSRRPGQGVAGFAPASMPGGAGLRVTLCPSSARFDTEAWFQFDYGACAGSAAILCKEGLVGSTPTCSTNTAGWLSPV